jgi:putative transposase
MANTYTQLYIHLVFAVKNRDALIKKQWKDDLEKYITGIVQKHEHKLLALGTMPDHAHIFVGYNVNQLIPDLVENIKTSSNGWSKQINCQNSSLSGRRDTVPFHIPVLNWIRW